MVRRMKSQFALVGMLLALTQNANAQAPVGPVGPPPVIPTDSTHLPVLPLGPKEEIPNPDQPPVLVCTRPLQAATRKSPKVVQVLVADRETKTVAVTDQARGAIEYHRSRTITTFTKSANCLEFLLEGTTSQGEPSSAILEMDLERSVAVLNEGAASGPSQFPTCKIFGKGDYLKVGTWIRSQL
jgi:hypothetical protein